MISNDLLTGVADANVGKPISGTLTAGMWYMYILVYLNGRNAAKGKGDVQLCLR